MAFPLSPVLDDFNRADSADLGDLWKNKIRPTDLTAGWTIASNVARSTGGAPETVGAYWWEKMRRDVEVYATIAEVDVQANNQLGLWARIQNPGTQQVAAFLVVYNVNLGVADNVQIARIENNVIINAEVLVTNLGTDAVAGDKIGMTVYEDIVTAYVFQAGSWTALASKRFTHIPNPGYIGMRVSRSSPANVGWSADDFGGGPYRQPALKAYQTSPTP